MDLLPFSPDCPTSSMSGGQLNAPKCLIPHVFGGVHVRHDWLRRHRWPRMQAVEGLLTLLQARQERTNHAPHFLADF